MSSADYVKVPRVAIYIPGITSKVKLEPRYVLPIYQKMWNHTFKDKTDLVRLIPFPKESADSERYKLVPSDGVDPCEQEMKRLQAEFAGTDPETNKPLNWFDIVYPNELLFRQVFESTVAEKPRAGLNFSPQEEAMIKTVGISKYREIMVAGFNVPMDVVNGDMTKLSRFMSLDEIEEAQAKARGLASLPTVSNDVAEEFVVAEQE